MTCKTKILSCCLGLMLVAVTMAQTAAVLFRQDFEGVVPGLYESLAYSADGVDVTIATKGDGYFEIKNSSYSEIKNSGTSTQQGTNSLYSYISPEGIARIDFSAPVHGIRIDMGMQSGLWFWLQDWQSFPKVTCFDADGNPLVVLGGVYLPPDMWTIPWRPNAVLKFTRYQFSVPGEPIITHCEAVYGIFDNLVVIP